MTLSALFLTSLAIGFSGAASPGPLLVACITQSVRGGFRGGTLVVIGHALMELLAVLGLSFGVGVFLSRPGVAPAVSLVGGLMLIWMGYGTARGALRGDMSLPSPEHNASRREAAAATGGSSGSGPGADGPRAAVAEGPQSLRAAIVTGIAASVSNPYWTLWWATVGLSYLTVASPLGPAAVGAFYLGHISADFAWYMAVAAAVAGGRRLLSARVYKGLLVACGLCLLGLGLFFAVKGLAALG